MPRHKKTRVEHDSPTLSALSARGDDLLACEAANCRGWRRSRGPLVTAIGRFQRLAYGKPVRIN